MEQETEEKTDHYYILFRDAAVPAPTDAEYKKRCEQWDLLIGDRAAYVWGYAGELSDRQAEKVQEKLNSRLDKRFRQEREFSDPFLEDPDGIAFLRRSLSEIRVILYKQSAKYFLARLSPSLAFLSHVQFKGSYRYRNFRIYPESAVEEQQILTDPPS